MKGDVAVVPGLAFFRVFAAVTWAAASGSCSDGFVPLAEVAQVGNGVQTLRSALETSPSTEGRRPTIFANVSVCGSTSMEDLAYTECAPRGRKQGARFEGQPVAPRAPAVPSSSRGDALPVLYRLRRADRQRGTIHRPIRRSRPRAVVSIERLENGAERCRDVTHGLDAEAPARFLC